MRSVDWQALIPPWLGSALMHGALLADSNLTIRLWNEWLEQHSGIAAAQALGRSLPELYPDLAQRGMLDCFTRALAGETISLDPLRQPYLLAMPAPGRPDLAQMAQAARVGPVTVDGQIVGVIATIAEQAGQAQAEIAPQQIFQLLDTALAHAPVGFGVFDQEMRFRAVNGRLAQYNALAADEHIGRSFRELFPEWGDRLEPFFRRAFDEGQPAIEVQLSGARYVRPDEIAHWQASYFPIELGDGRRIGVGILVEDITEQKRAEAAKGFLAELSSSLSESLDYRATMQRLADLMTPDLADWCAIDLLGEGAQISVIAHGDPGQADLAERIQAGLPAMPSPSGRADAALAAGRPLLIGPLSPASLAAAAPNERYLKLLRALGPRSCIIVPLHSGGALIGAILLARGAGRRAYAGDDLALADEVARRAVMALENVRLYTAAQRSRALAEEAVRVRDAFFSIAAHELRTPLTTLLGRAQMLQRRLAGQGAADERSQRTIQIVVAQAQRLNKMISALLDVSRIQTGRFSIDPAAMDLSALVRRVVEESRLTILDRAVTLQAPDQPLPIDGDEVRLEQMLQNLIGNAVKYSPNGGPVEVSLSRQAGQALLTVADSGIGISDEAQRQLFHRFYRAENAESQGISGMGIGLFVVKEIVELHGGSVAVRSAEGQGSAFSVRLPLRE